MTLATSQGRPKRTLAARLLDPADAATSVTVTAEQLATWYAAQLVAAKALHDRLAGALERANAEIPVYPRQAKNWPKWLQYWRLDARLRYAGETLALLEQRGHVLVCATHGIDGCDDLSPADYEGLSNRGLLSGEAPGAWSRWCERCRGDFFDAEAKRLMETHLQGIAAGGTE